MGAMAAVAANNTMARHRPPTVLSTLAASTMRTGGRTGTGTRQRRASSAGAHAGPAGSRGGRAGAHRGSGGGSAAQISPRGRRIRTPGRRIRSPGPPPLPPCPALAAARRARPCLRAAQGRPRRRPGEVGRGVRGGGGGRRPSRLRGRRRGGLAVLLATGTAIRFWHGKN